MTIIEQSLDQDRILDFVDDGIRQLQESGTEARYIVVGPEAYETLRQAIAARFRREPGYFETYNYIPIVLDPFRGDGICVLPSPRELVLGAELLRVE
jgi:hypothetical protein